MWRLGPAVLLSLLLHAALIFVLRQPVNLSLAKTLHPLTVFLVDPPSIELAPIQNSKRSTKQISPIKLLTTSQPLTTQLDEKPVITKLPDKSVENDPQQINPM